MKRAGFTMIELIFVIVILGILAAVAIPKLAATQKSAKAGVVEAFVGTMNRTVLPSMYAKAVRSNGSINTFAVSSYTDVPSEISLTADVITTTICPAGSWGTFATFLDSASNIIYCRDGNGTHPPKLSFTNSGEGNTTMPDTHFQ